MASITRTSQYTGKTHSREIDADQQALDAWLADDPTTRPLIQRAFPDLSADDREFLLTGIVPEEWAALFPPEDVDG